MNSNNPTFDSSFNELMAMAKDPKQLEAYRQREVRAIIDQAPEYMRPRLEGLQFQIDAHRTLHKDSPLGACIQLSKMMQESFGQLQDRLLEASQDPTLQALTQAFGNTNTQEHTRAEANNSTEGKKPSKDSKILPFPSQR